MSFPLRGAFLQVSNDKPDIWVKSLQAMNQLGMSLAIVQTEGYLRVDDHIDSVEKDRLDRVFKCADELNMKIWMGLVYPHKNGNHDYVNNANSMTKFICKSSESVDRIWDNWGGHPSFNGFYLVYEGWTPISLDELGMFGSYLTVISKYCKTKRSDLEIAISPFVNKRTPNFASVTEEFYRNLLPKTELTVVMLQDGVGSANIPLETVLVYMQAMKKACEDAGIDMWANVESFADGAPTSFASLKSQIETVKTVTNKMVTYEFANYWMEQIGGDRAADLYKGYYNEYR